MPTGCTKADRRPAARRAGRLAIVVVAGLALVAWGVLDVRERGRIDPDNPAIHRTDFTVYTAAAEALLRGEDPYEVRSPRGWRYLYPPLAAVLVIPLTPLAPPDQVLAWFMISLLLHAACYLECARLAGFVSGRGEGPRAGGWDSERSGRGDGWVRVGLLAAGAAVLLPALNGLQRGQFNVVVLYCLLLGFRLVRSGRRPLTMLLGGVALSAAAVLKLTPALVVLCILLCEVVRAFHARRRARSRRAPLPDAQAARPPGAPDVPSGEAPEGGGRAGRRPLWAGAGVVFGGLLLVLVIPGAVSGWRTNRRNLTTWAERVLWQRDLRSDAQVNPYSVRNQSLSNAVFSLGNWFVHVVLDGPDDRVNRVAGRRRLEQPMDHPLVAPAIDVARGAILLMLLAAAARLARQPDDAALCAAFGLACAATLLLSPLSWGHHYLIWAPGVLLVPLWLRGRMPRAAAWLAWSPAALTLAHYAAVEEAGRVGLLGLAATAWFAAACVFVGWAGRADPSRRAGAQAG